MTEIRKAVLKVCNIAENDNTWCYRGGSCNHCKYDKAYCNGHFDYDLRNEREWKLFVEDGAINAFNFRGKSYLSCNKHMEQETIQFSETTLRDTKVITAIISWVERNKQTGTIHLQLAHCTRTFGNHY